MPPDVFVVVIDARVVGDVDVGECFRRGMRKDTVERQGIPIIVKRINFHRQLLYGIPSDFCGDRW